MRKGLRHIIGNGQRLLILLLWLTAMAGDHAMAQEVKDTLRARFPVAKTVPEEYKDLQKHPPADLRNPENITSIVDYDLKTGMYILRTKVGDMELGTPLTLTPDEYQDYSMQEAMQSYYRKKNEESFRNKESNTLNFTDMRFNIGPADKLFGPGGIRVKSQGSAELITGLKYTGTQNPSLPERSRSNTAFNFDMKVQLNMQASVGTKVNFGLNYNTESSFSFDASRINLAYRGEEDDIVKNIEAGNVSLNTGNSLIRGGAALFGIKTEMQFGKLRINTLLAQQESETQSVTARGGAQTREFEITVDQYDENQHFFLSHYFREQYDKSLARLPYISSGVKITRMEVWITNKRGNYDQARNILAFADLAENNSIFNPSITPSGLQKIPYNEANTLYRRIIDNYPQAREISSATQTLSDLFTGGVDYEKVESAQRLDPHEYTYNNQLGYISLRRKLQADEVLAVAYEYTYNGDAYQVGEFSIDDPGNTSQCLYLKLIKGTNMSPAMPSWQLMMKNVYSLNAYDIQKEQFRLDIMYQNDTTGTYLNYLTEGKVAHENLLSVMNVDRLDNNDEPYPNGFYDFVNGFTILASEGKIIFPVVEPFGSHLRQAIGNDAIADNYVFQELYDSTQTIARQIAEKNKFILRGEYRSSSSSEIMLDAMNVARGSVVVTAGGNRLTENVDYLVNYSSGSVTIINEAIKESNTPVQVSLENQSTFSMQRKNMMGIDLNYEFSKDFTMGATIMHLSEMPLTTKVSMGEESIKNTLWGANLAYKTESQWLTNMIDKLPLLHLTQPSQISLNAEFAHLIPGHYENQYTGKYAYIDDFESTQSGFDLLNPYPWALASVPYDNSAGARFPEAALVNDVNYGKNRALFAWYYIDGIFTRKQSSLRPAHITTEDISNHYVRAIEYRELFPNKERIQGENNGPFVLNLAYYPSERGPYNLDATSVEPDGRLSRPESRWGGMMRRIEQSDFEEANIEYIKFWVMDPFIYNSETATGGELYFNLGELSEDILRDEKKFFENGLPVDGNMSMVDTTVWGKVPRQQSTVYAFDNTAGSRKLQDVGLNGLSSEEEKVFPAYRTFLEELQRKLSPDVVQQMQDDPFSPFNDPATDNYHHYRGRDYDQQQRDILYRYKRYNGTEGNSTASDDSPESFDISSKMIPDVEDLNQDNTLNEHEKYYEYKVSLRPKEMEVGQNHIVDKRIANVKLANGTTDKVTWYLFKIPIREYARKVGAINDFKTIRFMRLYMTGFKEETVLRFATFELVRGDWRTYEQDLSVPGSAPSIKGDMEVSTINIEENGNREPIHYVLPPGVTRMIDPGQPQLRKQNEQALSVKVTNLASQDARAIYKRANYDMRRYKRMQLFVHAEQLINDATALENNDLSIFLRLGSDYKNNYYEYEVPLVLTPHANYTESNSDREAVWPQSNMLDFNLKLLTDLKLKRNKGKRAGDPGVGFESVFYDYDKERPKNKVSVKGNPSLSEVKTIMIGIRNNSKEMKSAEVWINELRMTDFEEEGGWAVNGSLNVNVPELGSLNASGRIETVGFGGLDQTMAQRNLEDFKQYAIATNLQLGRFLPEQVKASIPLYYAYSQESTSPQYNPLDQDIRLTEALGNVESRAEKDSILSFSQDRIVNKTVALNNIRVGIASKNPMPYDPANFSFGYAYNEITRSNPRTAYETTKKYQGNFSYNYTPYFKPFTPLGGLKHNNEYTKYFKQFTINYLPSSISFNSSMLRDYYEMQMRNLDAGSYAVNTMRPSFSQRFLWDRAFSIGWNPLNNLMVNFNSGTNSRIEEPHVQVNKRLNMSDYQLWRDSVKKSIAELGRPLTYDQSLQVTYALPLQHIGILNWINARVSYQAQYNWDRGSFIDEEVNIGNTIKNSRQLNLQGEFNLVNLYKKNAFLKKVNDEHTNSPGRKKETERKKKRNAMKFEGEVTLSADSAVIVSHGLLNKKVRVVARRMDDSSLYRVNIKVLDFARIKILNQDSVALHLTIYAAPPPTETFAYKLVTSATRFLMMVRQVNMNYSLTDGMMLPGFMPEIGKWDGQAGSPFGRAPGWGFAFGDVSEGYIEKAVNNNWLLISEENITPAMINRSENFTFNAKIEPIPGLKIDLTANRMESRDTEVQFMFNGMPTTYGGTFNMTTVALKGTLSGVGTAKNGYQSAAFDNFMNNTHIIAERLERRYAQTTYPEWGFLQGTDFAGQAYDARLGSVNKNSSDVMIPAFLAAYTGSDARSKSITPFPSLRSLLPNWRISYDGLIRLPIISERFSSISLNHQYRCNYNVGMYQSYLNWTKADEGIGFVRDIVTNNPIPSTGYDISTATISENFSPLIGIEATTKNNITTGLKYNKMHNLNLNISSFQLIETMSSDIVVTLGYKYADFNKVLKMRKKGDFNHDLTIRLDYSRRMMQSLIRKIEDGYTQMTQGSLISSMQFSAEYAFSKSLSARAFYDMQINKPLISSNSFPMTNSNYGINIRISLAQ